MIQYFFLFCGKVYELNITQNEFQIDRYYISVKACARSIQIQYADCRRNETLLAIKKYSVSCQGVTAKTSAVKSCKVLKVH
jgi:hypothetical protein